MALTAAQFFLFLGGRRRRHEMRWEVPGADPQAQPGLDAWAQWTATGADYQAALLSLAEKVRDDVTTLGTA